MAECPDPLFKLKEQVSCPVCLDVFTQPKLLVCNHALCKECIDHLPVNVDGRKHIVKCPTCRKPTTLPQQGAAKLPPAFHINTLIELHNATQGIILPVKPNVSDEAKCHAHDRPLEMFCDTCQELVCTKCFHCNHHNHSGDYVTDILAKHQHKIGNTLMTVKQRVSAVLNNFNSQLSVREKEIVQNGENIKNEIDTLSTEIVKLVQESAKQLKESVNLHVQQKLDAISKEKEHRERLLSQLKSYEEYIEEKMHKQEILVEMTEIIKNLWEVCQQVLMEDTEIGEKANIVFRHIHGISDVFSKIGEVSVDADAEHDTMSLKVYDSTLACTVNASCQTLVKLDSELAVVGKVRKITLRNVFGNPSISFIPNVDGARAIQCKSEEIKSGKHRLTFTPAYQGVYHIRVQNINRDDTPCNPSMIRVVSLPETTCKKVRTIEGFRTPQGIAFTRNGRHFLVTEYDSKTIAVVDVDGRIVKRFHHQGGSYPTDICTTHDDHILVLSRGTPYVSKYTLSDTTLVCTSGQCLFDSPCGIAVDHRNLVYVCDTKNNCIQVLNSDLSFSHVLGEKGTDSFQFNNPVGVAIDVHDAIFVCDSDNRRIQKLSGSSNSFQTFSTPRGIAVDRENLIYFTDSDGDVNIQYGNGDFLGRIYDAGSSGIAVDKAGDMYVCNYTTGTVGVYNSFLYHY